jgi:PKHD-type hydroxylase
MKIFQLLTQEKSTAILQTIREARFLDGKLSANGLAKNVKNNYEIDINDQNSKNIINNIFSILINNQWIKNHYLPKAFSIPIVNKYTTGNTYGRHFDNSFLKNGANFIRADLSYTLMLSSKSEYEGGELNIETGNYSNKIKLDAGQIIIYESMNWHRVEPILSGERVACIGWFESAIQNEEARELLSLWEDFQLSMPKENMNNDLIITMDYIKHKLQKTLSQV